MVKNSLYTDVSLFIDPLFLASARALPYVPLKSARNFQKITETAVQTSLDKCCFSNAVELLKNSIFMDLDQVQEEKEKNCRLVFTRIIKNNCRSPKGQVQTGP